MPLWCVITPQFGFSIAALYQIAESKSGSGSAFFSKSAVVEGDRSEALACPQLQYLNS
jgi:hypothetical protein